MLLISLAFIHLLHLRHCHQRLGLLLLILDEGAFALQACLKVEDILRVMCGIELRLEIAQAGDTGLRRRIEGLCG